MVRLRGVRGDEPCNREATFCQSEYRIYCRTPNVLSLQRLWKPNRLDLQFKWWNARGALSAHYLQTILIPAYLSSDKNKSRLSHTARRAPIAPLHDCRDNGTSRCVSLGSPVSTHTCSNYRRDNIFYVCETSSEQ